MSAYPRALSAYPRALSTYPRALSTYSRALSAYPRALSRLLISFFTFHISTSMSESANSIPLQLASAIVILITVKQSIKL
jgi:hypothetical protein